MASRHASQPAIQTQRHRIVNNQPLIVISLEGLAASSLGCYGCSWNETPTIDRLANKGCVWDRFLATLDDPSRVLGDWIAPSAVWADQLRSSLGPIEFITDRSAKEFKETCFDTIHCLPVDPIGSDSLPAQDIAETRFGQIVAAALERDRARDPWGVLWIDSQFLTRCWDAPRELMLAEDDHETLDFDEQDWADPDVAGADDFSSIRPPQFEISNSRNPDLVTDWMNAYACQLRLVDLLIGILLESIQVADPTLVLVGTSGFRLGQGSWIGHRQGPLRSPDVRLPLIINRGGPLHIPQLTPADELDALLKNLGDVSNPVCSPEAWNRQSSDQEVFAIESDRATLAIANSKWFYVKDADQSEHLFLKPDDVEDFNDVGRLRSDVIANLQAGF